ncbi:MAG: hypothetical protein JW730_18350 [Anaerolineales bacterium]|nr:hypothetical protein [Anaerolineales bacterium]
MSDEALIYQGEQLPVELSMSRPATAVLIEARQAAVALKDVISKKAKPVIFNNEQYLEFEDWQTLGRFYGVTAKVRATRFVQYGDVIGFEAEADALNVKTGMIISSAEAMCLNDEEKWSSRTKYEWAYVKKSGGTSIEDPGKSELIWEKSKEGKSRPKKVRIKTGEEKVPLFQLRSMAQTRACAKALRNVMAWVAVLAGYRPTPAEELSREEDGPPTDNSTATDEVPPYGEQVAPPPERAAGQANGSQASNGDNITEKQRSRMCAIWRKSGFKDDQAKQILTACGFEHTADVTRAAYQKICEAFEIGTPDQTDLIAASLSKWIKE